MQRRFRDNETAKTVFVALTIDTESDHYFGDNFPEFDPTEKSIAGWKGLEIGKKLLAESVQTVADEMGFKIPLTWFVRCDAQIAAEFGDAAFLLNNYKNWWDQRLSVGDEIQWHAHLYRNLNGKWQQETRKEFLKKDLESSLRSLHEIGVCPEVVRMGESYHSDELMKVVSELGLVADSTAMPGRKRQDWEKTIDWLSTPNFPYHPSKEDYRVSLKKGYELWEIPLNTVSTKVSYDSTPILRYVNLAFHKGVLDKGLVEFFMSNSILVSITHPFEVVAEFYSDKSSAHHPLLSFNPKSVGENIQAIVRAADFHGKRVKFVTMTDLLAELSEYDG